jgi:hypothetical protein
MAIGNRAAAALPLQRVMQFRAPGSPPPPVARRQPFVDSYA